MPEKFSADFRAGFFMLPGRRCQILHLAHAVSNGIAHEKTGASLFSTAPAFRNYTVVSL